MWTKIQNFKISKETKRNGHCTNLAIRYFWWFLMLFSSLHWFSVCCTVMWMLMWVVCIVLATMSHLNHNEVFSTAELVPRNHIRVSRELRHILKLDSRSFFWGVSTQLIRWFGNDLTRSWIRNACASYKYKNCVIKAYLIYANKSVRVCPRFLCRLTSCWTHVSTIRFWDLLINVVFLYFFLSP